jgi:hypothetical protein
MVHYVPRLGPPTCLAAIVTHTSPPDQTITHVIPPDGETYIAYPLRDPHLITDDDGDTYSGYDGYTPGTWHPLH